MVESLPRIGGLVHGSEDNPEFGDKVAMATNGENIAVVMRGAVGVAKQESDGSFSPVGNTIRVAPAADDPFNSTILPSDVAMNGDGTKLVFGVDEYAAMAGVANAYVLSDSGEVWNKLGEPLVGVGSVDMDDSGNRIVVSSFASSFNETVSSRVYDFDSATDNWNQVEDLEGTKITDLAQYHDVAISGDGKTVVLSTLSATDSGTGFLRVYTLDGSGEGAQKGQDIEVKSPPIAAAKGLAVSSDGGRVVTAAPGDSQDAPNHVVVYDWDGSSWKQSGELEIPGGTDLNNFGTSIDISADGNTVVVGAPGSAQDGIFGIPAEGRAYVFKKSGETWTLEGGADLVPNSNTDLKSLFGYSVGVAGDGSKFVAGAPHHYTIDNPGPDDDPFGAITVWSTSVQQQQQTNVPQTPESRAIMMVPSHTVHSALATGLLAVLVLLCSM